MALNLLSLFFIIINGGGATWDNGSSQEGYYDFLNIIHYFGFLLWRVRNRGVPPMISISFERELGTGGSKGYFSVEAFALLINWHGSAWDQLDFFSA